MALPVTDVGSAVNLRRMCPGGAASPSWAAGRQANAGKKMRKTRRMSLSQVPRVVIILSQVSETPSLAGPMLLRQVHGASGCCETGQAVG